MWQAESTNKTKDKSKLTFSLCCHAGRVSLPRVKKTPEFLDVLLKTSATFRQNIRRVNSAFAFTSTGAKVDESINNKPGPYTYRVHGQNCHRLGSLLPTPGEQPKYSQMYIFDTANEVKNRIRSLTGSISSTSLDEKVVSGLKEMLDSTNDLTKIYRSARDRYESGKPTDLTIRLVGQRHRGKQYDLPRSEEIAGLIVGDLSSTTGARDIILELQSNDLQRISELHPLYMALQYPLLFPYREDGYHVNIPYATANQKAIKRECVTMLEYYAYQIQTRLPEGMTLIRSGRLLHQYAVDAYMAIEQERMGWYRRNQKTLRADVYNNICDAIDRGDSDAKQVGRKVILPSSFTGGPRYMTQNYQDAMAICRTFGNPDLFITMTANPKWEEIKDHLERSGNSSANDRPNLICRVFKMKLDALMADLWDGDFFGEAESSKSLNYFQLYIKIIILHFNQINVKPTASYTI